VIPGAMQHLPGIVECHVAAFPEEISTIVGRRFVGGMYRFFLDRPDAITLVAIDETTGAVAGVVIGGRPGLRSGFVLRRWPVHLPAVLYAGVRRRAVRRLLFQMLGIVASKTWRKLHLSSKPRNRPGPLPPPAESCSLLQSICTHPSCQRRGVGSALAEAFGAESARRGYKVMRLSASEHNVVARALYEKQGWKKVGQDGDTVYFERDVSYA
jgi:ribosomal protein S18 acetylase RimI-like enzyme